LARTWSSGWDGDGWVGEAVRSVRVAVLADRDEEGDHREGSARAPLLLPPPP